MQPSVVDSMAPPRRPDDGMETVAAGWALEHRLLHQQNQIVNLSLKYRCAGLSNRHGARAPERGEVASAVTARPRCHLHKEISVSTKFIACAAAAVAGTIAFSGAAVARDQIQIAGSST